MNGQVGGWVSKEKTYRSFLKAPISQFIFVLENLQCLPWTKRFPKPAVPLFLASWHLRMGEVLTSLPRWLMLITYTWFQKSLPCPTLLSIWGLGMRAARFVRRMDRLAGSLSPVPIAHCQFPALEPILSLRCQVQLYSKPQFLHLYK